MAQHRRVTATAGGTTPAVLLDGGPFSVGIRLAGGGSGKVQYSLSSVKQVEDGTAVWKDSSAGVVSADTDTHVSSPVTAVRGVSAVGAIVLEIVYK